MPVTGKGKKGILVVAEAPGAEEDERGEQLVGEAGQLLRQKLRRHGISLDRDCWKINAVNCRPPNNRKPTRKELKCCRPMLDKAMKELKPKYIWLFGGAAIESFFMGRFSDLSVSRWRRHCIPDYDCNAFLIPMYHPSALLHNRDDKYLEMVFDRDLEFAVSCIGKKLPERVDYSSLVNTLTGFEDICSLLRRIIDNKEPIVFDYETTGLKPYETFHRVVVIGVGCEDSSEVYSFPFQYNGKEGKLDSDEINCVSDLWKKVLTDPEIKKTAHNVKFEHCWSMEIFGVEPVGWVWDTMIAQHIIDDRHGITSLKFQSYVRWGVDEYDKGVKKFLGVSVNNKINSVDGVPLSELGQYNGLDVLFTRKLKEEQLKELPLGDKRREAYALFHEGILALADAQHQGICVDEGYYEREKIRLTKRIDRLDKVLASSREAKLFVEKVGKEINTSSTKDLRILFFDILGLKPVKLTQASNASVDEETLSKIDSEFARNLLLKRKLTKIRDTYLAQFEREVVNGKIHPFYDLHIARSYRSSSSMPNFQNIPVRDELAKASVRKGIVPSRGNKIMSCDYKGIEVCIAACITKDPVLVGYICDPKSDMHKDEASNIFLLEKSEVSSELRYLAKNRFVFPEFYGSYWKSCAKDIWNGIEGKETESGVLVRDHLERKGIKVYRDFEEHVREVENRFWSRFKVFREWQEEVVEKYLKTGYVEMPFGFRRGGYLRRNIIINTPIQGTAFHCLLWSYIKINKIRKEEGWRTKILGEIHDEILFDLSPDEEEHVIGVVKKVMCEDIRKEFDWIIVPLDIDIELTGVDQSWYYKKEIN